MTLNLSKISPYCVDSQNETCFGLDWYTRSELGYILVQKRVVQSLLPKKKQRIDTIIGLLTKKEMIQILRYHHNPLVRDDMNKSQLISMLLGSKNVNQNAIEAYYKRIKQWIHEGNVKFKGPPRGQNKVGGGRKGPTLSSRAKIISSIKANKNINSSLSPIKSGKKQSSVVLVSQDNSSIQSLHFPIHVSPLRSPLNISPSPVRSPIRNSPVRSPIRNSPVRSPVSVYVSSPVRSPIRNPPVRSPIRNSPVRSPVSVYVSSPVRSPIRNSPVYLPSPVRSPHSPARNSPVWSQPPEIKKCVFFSKRKPVGNKGNVVEIDGKTLTIGAKIKAELTADVEYYIWVPTINSIHPGTYIITATPQVDNVSSQEKNVTVETQLIPKSYEGVMNSKKGVFLPVKFSLSNGSSFFVKNPKSSNGKGSTNYVITVSGGGLIWKTKIYQVKPHISKKNSAPSPPSSPILTRSSPRPVTNSVSPILSRSPHMETPRVVSQRTTSPHRPFNVSGQKTSQYKAHSPVFAPVSLPQKIQRTTKKKRGAKIDYDGDMPPPLGGPNPRYKPPRKSSR